MEGIKGGANKKKWACCPPIKTERNLVIHVPPFETKGNGGQ